MTLVDIAPETRLVRSGKGGGTIHLRGCSRVGKDIVGWRWAEGRPDSDWLAISWFQACAYCLPQTSNQETERDK